jgi:hypothetical protein
MLNKKNSEQPLLLRISGALEDLSDDAGTILDQGMAELDWGAFDDHAGEAVDIVNLLDEWGPSFSKNISALTECLKSIQDTKAWYSMPANDRNLIRAALYNLSQVSLWTEPRSNERPLCLCRNTKGD